jgi:hypothetical protein
VNELPQARLERPGLRRTAKIALATIAVLLLGEFTVRLSASTLPQPQLWSAPEFAVKEPQIDALAKRGGASIMMIGSSTMDVAADPSQMRFQAGSRGAYNAATGGASIGMIDIWSRLVATPKLRPDVAVVGIVTRELNENDPEQIGYERDFFASKKVHRLLHTETLRERVAHQVEDASYLFRFRTVLNQPGRVLDAFGVGGFHTAQFGEIVAGDGQYEGFLNGHSVDTAQARAFLRDRTLHDYRIGLRQVATLRRLLEFLTQRHIKVVVVNMPVTDIYVDSHPHGKADYDRGVAVIRHEADRVHAEYLDIGVWPRVLFADPAHVNRAGAKRFTDILQRTLVR